MCQYYRVTNEKLVKEVLSAVGLDNMEVFITCYYTSVQGYSYLFYIYIWEFPKPGKKIHNVYFLFF